MSLLKASKLNMTCASVMLSEASITDERIRIKLPVKEGITPFAMLISLTIISFIKKYELRWVA